MRELKFRAWVYYGEKLKEPHYSDEYSLSRFFEDHNECCEDQCIEQYTGLKDKNGKEIYEGDIVDYDDDGDCIGIVKYKAPEFYLDAYASNWAKMALEDMRYSKVIGNIHENKDLLEEK